MAQLILKGKAFKFGNDISTDLIIAGRYAHLRSNLPELAKHVSDLKKQVAGGDVGTDKAKVDGLEATGVWSDEGRG